ncbi:MAG TPA: 4-hydroxybenzoate octaprenyltransferase [Planctomycetes bacterium]|nr:4-hydroxybenzoate octaprenyltransferase [Planctomycetota bacterium]
MARLQAYLSLVKFSHSVFALPFALISLVLAEGGLPPLSLLLLVVLAAVAARTAAMGFNRWADRKIDEANPRTREREIPAGKISPRATLVLVLLSSLVFMGTAWALNPLAFWLSPLVLVVLLGYSYTKRFTWACHLVLGLALGLAPLGAWIAAKGSLEDIGIPLLLAFAVLTWVAGFDIIYSCQDEGFDRGLGLHSIPARFGIRMALRLSSLLHLLTVASLGLMGVWVGLGLFWWLGVVLSALLLFYEHRLVRPDDLSQVKAAFFTMNGLVSLLLAMLTFLDFLF